MTEQILCLSFILKFSLQVSSLHHPACLPRNITGPCRLIPWLVPCFQVMRPTGQDSLRSRMRHMLWVSDAPTVLASSIHVEPWTVIAERPKIKFDLWQVKAALEMSVTGVLAGMLFVNCVISVCVLSISHITASLSFSFHLAYTGSLRSGLLLVPFRRS